MTEQNKKFLTYFFSIILAVLAVVVIYKLPEKVNPDVTIAGRLPYIFFFIFILGVLIIRKNVSKGTITTTYVNPYVNTNLYKLPITVKTKFPAVNFPKITLQDDEKLLFAGPTNQKDNEGDFAITNTRVVIYTLSGQTEFSIFKIDSVSTVTSSVFMITEEGKKHYIFMDESLVQISVQILKFLKNN